MRSIHPEPHRLATRDDLVLLGADLRGEMAGLGADLRIEMAQLRAEMAELRADVTETVSAAITTQTRTLLIGLIVAIVASNLATIVT